MNYKMIYRMKMNQKKIPVLMVQLQTLSMLCLIPIVFTVKMTKVMKISMVMFTEDLRLRSRGNFIMFHKKIYLFYLNLNFRKRSQLTESDSDDDSSNQNSDEDESEEESEDDDRVPIQHKPVAR